MHHDRMHAHELQKNDVCGEFAGGFGIAHGVAARFHNNDLAIIDLDIGQRFRERLGGSQAPPARRAAWSLADLFTKRFLSGSRGYAKAAISARKSSMPVRFPMMWR